MRRLPTILAAAAIAVTACTPSSDSGTSTTLGATTSTTASTTTTEPAAESSNEVVIGVGDLVTTLNPFADNAFAETNLVGRAVWATIYDIVPETWERVPDSVTSLPSQTPGAIEMSEDGSMVVRYEVQKGATWSDGTPITGEDIAFTAEAMAQIAAAGSPGIHPIMATITSTDFVERIAWITFSEASLAFEDALWIILPSHAIESIAELKVVNGFDWPSGGPFMVVDSPKPSVLNLERNPNYWKTDDDGKRLPYLDRLTIISSLEHGLEVDLFASRSVDVLVVPNSPEVIDAIPQDAELQRVPTPILEHLTFQFGPGRDELNPTSLNDSLDYRRAIAYSIDRQTLLLETDVPWMPEIPGMLTPLGRSPWDAYSYDVAAGRASLQAVWGDAATGFAPEAVLSTTGNGDYRVRIGDALIDGFNAVSIPLATSYPDSMIFFGEQLGAGEFDIGMWAWPSNGGYGDQIALMERFDPASEADDANYGKWGVDASASDGTAAFSELVAEARTTIDPVRFAEIVERAEQLLAEDLPLIPLFHRSSVAAVWTDSVAGIVHNGSSSDLTWNVETWQKP